MGFLARNFTRIIIFIIIASFLMPDYFSNGNPELQGPMAQVRDATGDLLSGVKEVINQLPWERIAALFALGFKEVKSWFKMDRIRVD